MKMATKPPQIEIGQPPVLVNYFQDTVRGKGSNISNFFRNIKEEQECEGAIEKGVQLAAKRMQDIAQQNDEEAKLATELVNNRRKRFLEQKARQDLRENNEELRELEIKLRAAYVGKGLAAQIAEREAFRQHERLLCDQENDHLEAARVKDAEYRRLQMEETRRRKKKLREEMMQQMAERDAQRAKLYEDFLKEKKWLDEICRKLIEEEMMEIRKKQEIQAQFRSDVRDYLQMHEFWKKLHKRSTDEEDRKLVEFIENRDRRIAQHEREKAEERLKRAEIGERIGREVAALVEEKQKRRELIEDLLVSESHQKSEEKLRNKLESELRERIQVRLQLEQQRANNIQRKLNEQEEDRLFREEQMKLYAERDRLELLSNEKRRRKILEHRKELQTCLMERKKRRAEEVAMLLKQRDEDIEEENTRKRLIEEERIRMLKEHATELMGFLPVGILRESDREFLALPPKS